MRRLRPHRRLGPGARGRAVEASPSVKKTTVERRTPFKRIGPATRWDGLMKRSQGMEYHSYSAERGTCGITVIPVTSPKSKPSYVVYDAYAARENWRWRFHFESGKEGAHERCCVAHGAKFPPLCFGGKWATIRRAAGVGFVAWSTQHWWLSV